MDVNAQLIVASVAAIVVGALATALVVYMWPPSVSGLAIMGPFCLILGIAMLAFALRTRRDSRR